MHILLIPGSLRKDSFNKKFLHEAARLLKDAGHSSEVIDLKAHPLPLYDGDIQDKDGIPAEAKAISQKIAEAGAVIVASPEYNGAIASPLKNLIDWLSRDTPMTLAGKHLLLLSASPGVLSGVRGLWHTRVPFEAIGVHVFPQMMGLPAAHTAFDDTGMLKDTAYREQFRALLGQFTAFAGR